MEDQPQVLAPYEQYFGPEYKHLCFMIWYRNGKPSPTHLLDVLPIDELVGRKPGIPCLKNWVKDFEQQAHDLDMQVSEELNKRMIAEKVEMLHRHAGDSKAIQEWAMDFLKEHKGDFTVSTATRLWVEATRIERASRGIPSMFDKINDATDEDLLKELQKVVTDAPPTFEQIGEDEDDES